MVQNQQKTVFFLGAGASKASDFNLPTMREFFLEDVKEYKELSDILNWYYPGQSYENYNLENVFAYLELSRDRMELWQRYAKDGLNVNRNQLLAQLLQYAKKRLTITKDTPCELHKRLFLNLNPNDSIITINWDLVADQSLEALEKSPDGDRISPRRRRFRKLDFMVLAQPIQSEFYFATGLFQDLRVGGFYLKLHGSLDWIQCPIFGCQANTGFINLRRDPNYPDDPTGEPCPYCGAALRMVLVAPTPSKRLKDRGRLAVLWNFAYQELISANRWVLVGLSMAPTDFELQWLFRQAQENHLSLPIEVHVVNPNKDDRENIKNVCPSAYCSVVEHMSIEDYLKE